MAMQAQDRRDAGETLFTRVLWAHGHLQTACAMLEGSLTSDPPAQGYAL